MAKRETNKERAAREYDRRTTFQMAKWIAEIICERRKSKADLAPEHMEDLPAKKMKRMGWHPESKRWRKTYTWLGQVFCEFSAFDEAPSKFLRVVADFLDGKPPRNVGKDWYDDAIWAAYHKAASRRRRFEWIPRPSFTEFLEEFLSQNPKSKLPRPPSDRSLRRSLKRLGYRTRPDKRGRPKE